MKSIDGDSLYVVESVRNEDDGVRVRGVRVQQRGQRARAGLRPQQRRQLARAAGLGRQQPRRGRRAPQHRAAPHHARHAGSRVTVLIQRLIVRTQVYHFTFLHAPQGVPGLRLGGRLALRVHEHNVFLLFTLGLPSEIVDVRLHAVHRHPLDRHADRPAFQ